MMAGIFWAARNVKQMRTLWTLQKANAILTIIDLAGDELTTQEQHGLWLESTAQLVERLIHIAHWYAREYHETP
jgi:hypothetical protein